jgi:glycosyltransferase involved in cell wall biosynthesis
VNDRRTSIHILIIVQNLPVPFDRRVWQEANTLSHAGYGVHIICPKKGVYQQGHEVIEGIDIYRYPSPFEGRRNAAGYFLEFGWCWVATALLSIRIYGKSKFRVIHACNPPDTFFLLGLAFKLLGVKFVFDHHDLSPEMYLAKGARKGSILHKVLLLLERATFRTADFVIAVNESHREIAIARGGLASEKVMIVRSGPPMLWGRNATAKEDLRRGYRFMVLYLGEMCMQDGVDYLLRAILHYREHYGDETLFTLVGGGPEKSPMEALARELSLDPIVRFTGRIPDKDLWEYLATCDICVDPDPLTEWSNLSTMNKIIEYMAFGKPIVAFDLREARHSAGDSAVYIRPNEVQTFAKAVRSLLLDPSDCRKRGSLARRRFEESLCWEISAGKLLEVYSRLSISDEKH